MTAESEERVLWTGSPQRIPLFEPLDRLAIPLQALVVVIAVVFAVMRAGTPTAIALWIFVALAVLVVPIRMIVRRVTAAGSRYTVTDRRMIVRTRKGREFTRALAELGPPVAYPHRDGTGTIEFKAEREDPRDRKPQTSTRFTLWGILDAPRVRDIIAGARQSATG